MRPLVWLLAAPRVVRRSRLSRWQRNEPMLIIANHVTAYDEPLLLYALPRAMRNRIAAAMSGEMLEDFRHARNKELRWLAPLGPIVWLLLTALFNAFPLPRQRGFQRSFAHAGEALDRGFHVVVFPEGTRSAEGVLANFRPGIGLLVKQSSDCGLADGAAWYGRSQDAQAQLVSLRNARSACRASRFASPQRRVKPPLLRGCTLRWRSSLRIHDELFKTAWKTSAALDAAARYPTAPGLLLR